MEKIVYPPEKIYSPAKWNRPNYDHIILWMLNNNEMCKWADFSQEPVEIPPGTLSRHLETLKRNGFVDKITRGHYKITSDGKKKFRELSSPKRYKRKLNYPPEVILKSGRNYLHWILWMVYNNEFCKRSEFLDDPLTINQSSLSKNLGLLVDKGFIIKEEGKYTITRTGKLEYSEMLKNYNLDRQTILEEEGKRIEELTNKTIKFFKLYEIKDKDIQFRFLNNLLTLNYENVKSVLKNEEIFHKILLFISINHPDQYPSFISSENFSQQYNIKKTTLDYYIDEISEGKIYPLRYFKLSHSSKKFCYFQSNGRIERMLRVITENKLTKEFYMDKLYSKSPQNVHKIDMESIIDDIVNRSAEFLLNEDLKKALKEFLPEYIEYLAYKIESKREISETYDKLEGIIWQSIANIVQSESFEDLEHQYELRVEKIDKKIEQNPDNLELYYSKIRTLIYFNLYQDALKLLDTLLEMFPESEKDISLLKVVVYRRTHNVETGLEIINKLIRKFPEDNDLLCYKAYWMYYLDNKEAAIKQIQDLIKKEPKNGLYHDTYAEILMYFEDYEAAAKMFLKAMVIGIDDWYIYQTYIKLGICYNALENYDLALKNLTEGKDLANKSTFDPETKQRWLNISDLFLSMIENT